MKKLLIVLLAGLWIFVACAPSQPATSAAPNVETVVAETMQALTSAAPPPTSAPSGIAVSYGNVSFVIPNGLALGAAGESVAAVIGEEGAPWEVAPAHIRFSFTGYNDALAKFSVMQISIFPAQDYEAARGNSLPRLQAILAAPAAPLDPKSMPLVPFFNATAMMTAQATRLGFNGGSGVRMVTQYGQAVMPIANSGTFYHFEGLTSDGRYYLVAILPIGAPFLANGFDVPSAPPPDGIPFPDMNSTDPNVFEAYFRAVEAKLNAADPNVFSPALPLLDALIQSITVAP